MDTEQLDNGPLRSWQVRQALEYAIDKDNILKLVHGTGVKAELHLPAGPAGL